MTRKKKEQIGLMPKASKEKKTSNIDPSVQLEIMESFKKMIDDGDIEEFFVIGVDQDRQVVIASYCSDFYTGLGILDMGKLSFINQQSQQEE